MKIEILTLSNQLVGTVANGVYQGIIVTVLVALSLRVLGRTNAATRHAVWFCTLLLLVSLFVAHCLIGPPRASEPKDVTTVSKPSLDAVLSGSTVAQDIAAGAGIHSIDSAAFHNHLAAGPEKPLEQKPDSQALSPNEAVSSEAPRNAIGNLISRLPTPDGSEEGTIASLSEPLARANVSGETTRLRWLAERLVNPVALNFSLGSTVPEIAGMIFVALWLTIGSIRVFVLLLQLSRIQKLKHGSLSPSTGLNELFQRLTSHLAVNRKVDLRIAPTYRSSFLLGFLRPVILLPAEERMEPGEAEFVLRHELAHVLRRDDWANLVQQFILAVFCFHPAVWWISKQLSLEREIACDDHVLHQSRRPQAYALLLASLAARLQRGLPLLAPGSSNNKTQLKQRIDMILNKHRNTSPRLAKTRLAVITSAAAFLAVAAICSAPRIVLAQNETAPASPNAPSADAPTGAAAPVVFAPDPPDSDSADQVPRTTPAPAGVGPGPKFKPGEPGALSTPPAVVAAPGAAPVVAVAPVPRTPLVAVGEPSPEPQVPRSPRPVRAPRAGNKDSHLEERLERLERMVESLVNQQHAEGRVDFQPKAEKDGMIDRKEIAKIEALAKRQAEVYRIDPKEIEKFKDLAEREAGRAIEQAKRATIEAEKAFKGEKELHATKKFKEGSQKQIEALRKQLEILEREREKLDHQIERLEQDQEQLDEP